MYILWATNLWQLSSSNGSSSAHHQHLRRTNTHIHIQWIMTKYFTSPFLLLLSIILQLCCLFLSPSTLFLPLTMPFLIHPRTHILLEFHRRFPKWSYSWATWWPLYFMVMIMSPFVFYVLLMLLLPLESHLVSTAAQMWLFSSFYLTSQLHTHMHTRAYK